MYPTHVDLEYPTPNNSDDATCYMTAMNIYYVNKQINIQINRL